MDYHHHPALSPLEAAVLAEYARLAHNTRAVAQLARQLTRQPDAVLLARLRVLESKMGLVLTLFKASVWGVINESDL